MNRKIGNVIVVLFIMLFMRYLQLAVLNRSQIRSVHSP